MHELLLLLLYSDWKTVEGPVHYIGSNFIRHAFNGLPFQMGKAAPEGLNQSGF